MGKVATITPSRLPMNNAIASEYDIDAPQWRVLVEQIFPTANSVESVLMALSYCKSRNLDIFKRPVYIVPMWSKEKNRMIETVWPGISEIRTTAARTGEYAGIDEIEYGPDETQVFTDNKNKKELTFPKWAKATVYRIVKGSRCPFTATVFWKETYATITNKSEVPNYMWQKRTRGQIAKCAEVAAIRMAFPEEVGNDLSAEEMEGQPLIVDHHETPAEQDLIPPPPPSAINKDELKDIQLQTPDEILNDAKTWFDNSQTSDDVERAWTEFEPHLDNFERGDKDKFNALYNEALQRTDPNTLMAG